MTYDIILAGVGGQGVLSIATIIARAAMIDGLTVRQSEVHGMSQRGGGVQAHMRIADGPISSDLIPTGGADMILAMEPMESLRYLSWLKPEGILVTAAEPFVNIPDYPEVETLYAAIRTLKRSRIVAAEALAREAGNLKSVNMVLIGAASSSLPVSEKALAQSVHDTFAKKDPKLVDINMKALALGEKA
ncbi:indolepyruvate oxidoreductase subunit beta [Treponema zuelzerae]|uniref:Indolepyruvate oxidoreductase subunit beta n=1 Tax=Teretinema zuelzerae TaxID=156 RepID=A0AAE3EJL6_9SPIR|nr:indolepyruvate oxidoreductase subunit beta [Teretinema zuelzerae]MBN2812252.1 indolepyruvate oxidoreductase subunit beta [Spirochaetales bacterium]MCD1655485.1 indolepyruvate oxidoreductase subunit beta [Teretinema zuelzerae]